MKTTLLLLAIVLTAESAGAQATMRGTVTDKNGDALPGVRVVAAGASTQRTVITDPAGRYELDGLPPGEYSLTAALAGFVTARRDGVTLADGQTVERLDFALCLGVSEEIDWVLPGRGGLADAWKAADVVAWVRIASTRPVRSDCPTRDVLQTATVVERFKAGRETRDGETLTFRQESWADEPAPYRVGQQMVVFLLGSPTGLVRLAGPDHTFLVEGDTLSSVHSPVETAGVTPADFMAGLRALAGGSARR